MLHYSNPYFQETADADFPRSLLHRRRYLLAEMLIFDPNPLERQAKNFKRFHSHGVKLKNDAEIILQSRFPSTDTYIFTTIEERLNPQYEMRAEPPAERVTGYSGYKRIRVTIQVFSQPSNNTNNFGININLSFIINEFLRYMRWGFWRSSMEDC